MTTIIHPAIQPGPRPNNPRPPLVTADQLFGGLANVLSIDQLNKRFTGWTGMLRQGREILSRIRVSIPFHRIAPFASAIRKTSAAPMDRLGKSVFKRQGPSAGNHVPVPRLRGRDGETRIQGCTMAPPLFDASHKIALDHF